jgi:hypothetical protein
MKKIIILILFAIGVAACRKDGKETDIGGSTTYYIKFKANGTSVKYDYATKQGGNYVDSSIIVAGKKLYVYALGAANSSGQSMVVGVSAENRLKAPISFQESDYIYLNSYAYAPAVSFIYNSEPGLLANMSLGMFVDTIIFPEFSNLPRNGTVTITEYTTKIIKGTFSGTVYQMVSTGSGLDVSQKTMITDGEFCLRLQ